MDLSLLSIRHIQTLLQRERQPRSPSGPGVWYGFFKLVGHGLELFFAVFDDESGGGMRLNMSV